MTTTQLSLESRTDDVHEEEHEQNDNWEWSDAFTEFIHDHVEGRSLKVCPGLRPICDVNLDIKHLGDIAQSEAADFTVTPIEGDSERLQELRDAIDDEAEGKIIYGEISAEEERDGCLYDGYACHGDMFDLPFEDNTFDTVVTDPPWLNLSLDERKQLFKEVVRVTKPKGNILYNATWIPEDEHARRFDLRFRQKKDFWDGPSFAAFYRRTARNIEELFNVHDYKPLDRYPDESPFWSEAYPPEALSTDHNTDPKKLSSDPDYQSHCCPMCGCSQLGQLRTEFFESTTGEYNTYECHNCAFRVDKDEIESLAEALETAAIERGVEVHDLSHIEYTPRCVEQALEQYDGGFTASEAILSPDLPWVPTDQFHEATNEGKTTSPSAPETTT